MKFKTLMLYKGVVLYVGN